MQGNLEDVKAIFEYSLKRHVIGSKNGKYSYPPDKDSQEMHFFIEGGSVGYCRSIYLLHDDEDGFKMVRAFSCSRVVSCKFFGHEAPENGPEGADLAVFSDFSGKLKTVA